MVPGNIRSGRVMKVQVPLSQDLLFLQDLPGREADPIRDQMVLENIRSDRTMIAVQLNQDLLFLQDHPDREADLSGNRAVMHVGQVLQDQAREGPVSQEDMAASLTANLAAVLSLRIPKGKA